MIELIRNTKIDFMGKRIFALVFSALMIILGIVSIVQISRGKANLGIDFAGGTAVQIKFNIDIPLQDIRKTLVDGGVTEFDLQTLTSENKVLIRIKKGEQTLGGRSKKIITVLSDKYSKENIVVDSTTEIGPKVGGRLRNDAFWAVIASIIGILIYITVRFQFKFSVGATVATFHDVLAVLGIFFLTGKEINLILVSALLMIAGYSLTDTVVIFDRIRENLSSRKKKSTSDIVNQSINECLSRTLITSLTTFFAAAMLYLLGGEVIHDFALAIMLGIVIGTYSSMFVASPVVLLFGEDKAFSKR
ncbi:MAG TPA: protein translocase subunit SecF [Nitrospirae bacterium]|nr:preprotein translocase subunit SecF [bacterium BMS3Abin09]GBE41320.1 preprotein translocase subunit SecF [bacterium BMS3Bbin09]HDH34890.1 protein translocase subunit SecF [Nitrospirota bacterium]HDZ84720.1 protein translocase subunit SecF [Nitrospirota bacterium]